MTVKEFLAPTLKDCLYQVRDNLGPEAVILETGKIRTGGVLGWRARNAVRIVAATGVIVDDQPAAPRPRQLSADAIRPTGPIRPTSPIQTRPFQEDEKITRLEQQIRELKRGMDDLRNAAVVQSLPSLSSLPSLPDELHPRVHATLRAADLKKDLANDLLKSLPDFTAWAIPAREAMAESALRDAMTPRIACSGPIAVIGPGTKVVALIGPTGVGKTTTIAKLAAHYALVEKCKVALVTLDTYRIAAVEQLRTYSQIIDLPLRVVHDARELGAALLELKDRELVFIDTAGRSHKNSIHVNELRALIDSVKIETHLVLSASTKLTDINEQVDRFASSAHIDRLLFSKLDETSTYGTLYTLAATRGIPVSYLTTGQRVPEDIELADSIRITNLVLHDLHEHGV